MIQINVRGFKRTVRVKLAGRRNDRQDDERWAQSELQRELDELSDEYDAEEHEYFCLVMGYRP